MPILTPLLIPGRILKWLGAVILGYTTALKHTVVTVISTGHKVNTVSPVTVAAVLEIFQVGIDTGMMKIITIEIVLVVQCLMVHMIAIQESNIAAVVMVVLTMQ